MIKKFENFKTSEIDIELLDLIVGRNVHQLETIINGVELSFEVSKDGIFFLSDEDEETASENGIKLNTQLEEYLLDKCDGMKHVGKMKSLGFFKNSKNEGLSSSMQYSNDHPNLEEDIKDLLIDLIDDDYKVSVDVNKKDLDINISRSSENKTKLSNINIFIDYVEKIYYYLKSEGMSIAYIELISGWVNKNNTSRANNLIEEDFETIALLIKQNLKSDNINLIRIQAVIT